jgi:hypothetical protein
MNNVPNRIGEISNDTYLIIKYINYPSEHLGLFSKKIRKRIVSDKNIYFTELNDGYYSNKKTSININEISSITNAIKLFKDNEIEDEFEYGYHLDYKTNSIVLENYDPKNSISIKKLDDLESLLSEVLKRAEELKQK